jgi:hypothetical protein
MRYKTIYETIYIDWLTTNQQHRLSS